MRRASALWEVFVLRFEEAPERYRQRHHCRRHPRAAANLCGAFGGQVSEKFQAGRGP